MDIAIDKIQRAEEHPLNGNANKAMKFRANRSFRKPVVSEEKSGSYLLFIGARSIFEARKAGAETINCEVVPVPSIKRKHEMLLTERYLCATPPLDMGRAFVQHREEYGITQQELSKCTGIAPGTIHHYESLVKDLAPSLAESLEKGLLTFKEARCIADLSTHARQIEIAKPFIRGEISSVHVERITKLGKTFPSMSVKEILDKINDHRQGEQRSSQRQDESLTSAHHQNEVTLEEKAVSLAAELEELRLVHIPEYRRLGMISSLRILESRLRVALEHLNDSPAKHSSALQSFRRRELKAAVSVR